MPKSLLLLVAIIAPLLPAAADSYGGNARTTTRSGATNDPIVFQTSGKKIIGKIFSNTFLQPIPFRGALSNRGRFRTHIDANGITGYFTGEVRTGRIKGSGKLRSEKLAASVHWKVHPVPPTDDEVPDLTGTVSMWLNSGPGLYKELELKVWKGDGRYEYKFDFIRSAFDLRDDHVRSNFPFPTPNQLPSVHNDFSRPLSPLANLNIQYTFRYNPYNRDRVFLIAVDVWKINSLLPDEKAIYAGFLYIDPD